MGTKYHVGHSVSANKQDNHLIATYKDNKCNLSCKTETEIKT